MKPAALSAATTRSASSDAAMQAQTVREIAEKVPYATNAPSASLNPQIAQEALDVREELTDASDAWPTRRLYADEAMQERLAWARGLRPDTRAGILSELERAQRQGPFRRLGMPGSSVEMQELKRCFPNFAEVLDFVWNRAILAGSVEGCGLRVPPVLLAGPPGVGKSALAERLAAWLHVPITRVDLSTLDASFRLTGLDAGYSTAKPGQVWDALQGPCISPVIVLEELDKRSASTSDQGTSFLLGLLEPATAIHFQDVCIGLPLDASQIQWLATCNDVRAIDPPLLSRFRVFEVKPPLGNDLRNVVCSVYGALRKHEIWARAFPEELPCAVVDALLDRTPREMWQALEDACANAAQDGRRVLLASDVVTTPKSRKTSLGFLN